MPLKAFFMPAPAPWGGVRFAVHHAPTGPVCGGILYVHPLAEEMNKSRRMATRQAERLARAGWHVLILDRLGCGDSDGDTTDMSWDAWRADVRLGLSWLNEHTQGPVWLWGLRAGCLLASDAASQGLCDGLLLWQPQASGQLAVHQFLRLRAAAAMLGGQATGAIEAARRVLKAGDSVNVAGYDVTAGLIDGLENATLPSPAAGLPVVWLEIGAEGAAPAPASQRVVDGWRRNGADVRVSVVAGPMFWQTTEIEDAPGLWQATDLAMAAAT